MWLADDMVAHAARRPFALQVLMLVLVLGVVLVPVHDTVHILLFAAGGSAAGTVSRAACG